MSEFARYKPLAANPPALAGLQPPHPAYETNPQSTLDKLVEDDETVEEVTTTQETPPSEEAAANTQEASTEQVQEEAVEEESVEEPKLKVESPLGGSVEIPEEETQEEPDNDDEAIRKYEEASKSEKKKREAFIHLSRSERQAKKHARELESKLKEAEQRATGAAPDPEIVTKLSAYEKELERIKQENDHYRKEFAVVAVDRSEEFQESVTKPWNEIVVPSIQVLTKSSNGEVNMSVVQDIALTEDPVARKEKLRAFKEKLEPDDYAELVSVVPKMREVIQKNTALKKNAQETMALKQREQEQQRKQFVEKYEGEVKKTYAEQDTRFRKQFFGDTEDPELDRALKASGQQAEALPWFEATPEVQATVKAALKNFPVAVAFLNRQLEKERQKIEKLEKELKEYKNVAKRVTAASPSAGGTTSRVAKQDDGEEVIDLKKGLTTDSLMRMLG